MFSKCVNLGFAYRIALSVCLLMFQILAEQLRCISSSCHYSCSLTNLHIVQDICQKYIAVLYFVYLLYVPFACYILPPFMRYSLLE
jgi:hypothetical protein